MFTKALTLTIIVYIGLNANAISYESQDGFSDTVLQVPALIGTWDMEQEFYSATRDSAGVYGTGSLVLVITEQRGRVFTGYEKNAVDPDDEFGPINGAVIDRSIRIGGYDFLAFGVLDSNDVIWGTYSNIPLAPDDEDYETGTFIAHRRPILL